MIGVPGVKPGFMVIREKGVWWGLGCVNDGVGLTPASVSACPLPLNVGVFLGVFRGLFFVLEVFYGLFCVWFGTEWLLFSYCSA